MDVNDRMIDMNTMKKQNKNKNTSRLDFIFIYIIIIYKKYSKYHEKTKTIQIEDYLFIYF